MTSNRLHESGPGTGNFQIHSAQNRRALPFQQFREERAVAEKETGKAAAGSRGFEQLRRKDGSGTTAVIFAALILSRTTLFRRTPPCASSRGGVLGKNGSPGGAGTPPEVPPGSFQSCSVDD